MNVVKSGSKNVAHRLGVTVLCLVGAALQAGPFTNGNLVIYRVGTGAAALTSAATEVFLDEYLTVGAAQSPVQSVAMPTTVPALTANGTSAAEGLLTRSTDGRYLVLGGYNCDVGTAVASGATSATVNRMIARVDSSSNIDVTTSLSDAFSAGNIRSVASVDGTAFWLSGSNEGVRYATLGATTSTVIANTVTNNRNLAIFEGQLYDSSGSGANRLMTIGTGLPTTGGQSITNLTFDVAPTAVYGYFFADLAGGVAGLDTVYLVDTTSLRKFCFDGVSWKAMGSVALASGVGLTGKATGSTVDLYITTSSTLYTLQDTSGYNVAITGSLNSLATATANTAFRGVAFAPTSPTVVTLNSFEASGTATEVQVRWTTGSEFEHAGFNLYRAAEANGNFTKLNPALIPAAGKDLGGASYGWTDAAAQPGQTWYYKLEDLDTRGVSTFHGPVSATVGATSPIRSFQATPASIFLGGGSWLSWAATGQVTLNGAAVTGTGMWVAPSSTTGYTLSDATGASRLVTVAVRPFAVKDMAGLSRAWGSAKGETTFDPSFDLNGDGKIDDADVALCLK